MINYISAIINAFEAHEAKIHLLTDTKEKGKLLDVSSI